jgi:hypothetical protein
VPWHDANGVRTLGLVASLAPCANLKTSASRTPPWIVEGHKIRAVHSSAITASLTPMATTDTSEIVYAFLPSEYRGPDTPGSMLHWQPLQVRGPYLGGGFPNLNRRQTSTVACPAAAQAPASKALNHCRWPGCQQQFTRKQELERHTLSLHLPCSFCCPHPSCSWRGTRKDELIKHVTKGRCKCKGAKLNPRQYKIYDAKCILDWIYEDSTLVNSSVVLAYVLDMVRERAMELRKTELWRGHQLKGRRG